MPPNPKQKTRKIKLSKAPQIICQLESLLIHPLGKNPFLFINAYTKKQTPNRTIFTIFLSINIKDESKATGKPLPPSLLHTLISVEYTTSNCSTLFFFCCQTNIQNSIRYFHTPKEIFSHFVTPFGQKKFQTNMRRKTNHILTLSSLTPSMP